MSAVRRVAVLLLRIDSGDKLRAISRLHHPVSSRNSNDRKKVRELSEKDLALNLGAADRPLLFCQERYAQKPDLTHTKRREEIPPAPWSPRWHSWGVPVHASHRNEKLEHRPATSLLLRHYFSRALGHTRPAAAHCDGRECEMRAACTRALMAYVTRVQVKLTRKQPAR